MTHLTHRHLKHALIGATFFTLAVACGGSAADDASTGDGDGDSIGDGDSGDGDLSGDGDMPVVGDGDGDVIGDGDVVGDGDGDVVGDGDGDGGIVCTDIYSYGLSVTVIGGAILPPGNAIPGDDPLPDECYTDVNATDGDYAETLECSPQGDDCLCFGAGERAGTYTVTAFHGNRFGEQEVTVTAGECHVQGESLTFFEP